MIQGYYNTFRYKVWYSSHQHLYFYAFAVLSAYELHTSHEQSLKVCDMHVGLLPCFKLCTLPHKVVIRFVNER